MPTEQIIRYKSPLNTTAEDEFAWDEDQAKQQINEANKIYTKQYRKDLADGFSRSEAKIKADEAADDYIYKILEENGL